MNIILSISKVEIIGKNIHNKIKKYLELGVTGFRINLAKYNNEDIYHMLSTIDEIVQQYTLKNFEFIFDIPLPKKKTRVTNMISSCIRIESGDELLVRKDHGEKVISKYNIFVDEFNFNCKINDIIYYGDGIGTFVCKEISNNYILLKAINSFEFYKNKSFNIEPIYNLNDDSVFENCAKLNAIVNNCYFALSFIENPKDIYYLCEKIGCQKSQILCKIETQKSIENIESLLVNSAGILLGRGDLLYYSEINNFFLNCIKSLKIAHTLNKKFYLCTDVMMSLINNNIANRADIIDVSVFKAFGCENIILPAGFSRDGNLSEAIKIIENTDSGFLSINTSV